MPPDELPMPPGCDEVVLQIVDGGEYLGLGQIRLFHVGRTDIPATAHPLTYVRPRTRPASRWDAPLTLARGGDRYGVWYGSTTPLGAMLEVFYYEDEAWVPSSARSLRVIGEVAVTRPLRLIDLHSPAVGRILPANRLDEGICTTRNYLLTQAWSELFHECGDNVDGLVYRSRKAGNVGVNLAIFERPQNALHALEAGTAVDDASLSELRESFVALTGLQWPP